MTRRLLAPLLLLPLLAPGCAIDRILTEPAPLDRPVVERVAEHSVRLRWPAHFSTGPVTIYAGPSPTAIDRTQPLAVATGHSVRLSAVGAGSRLDQRYRFYYELVPTDGDAFIAAERLLPLEGTDNFRDLGGYATRDGRRVRWGLLFRSNQLSGLTRQDLDYLSRIDIRLVCDFRSDRERSSEPNRVLEPGPPVTLDLPVEQEGVDPAALQNRIRTGGITALGIEVMMERAYRAFVTDHSERWAAMFRRITEPGNLPTVVHCTAGKDRTGFASALILLTLGVPEETVFEDYLLTNHYREGFERYVLRWVPLYSLFRTRPEDLLPLLEARREYLQTSLDAIEELHGSLDRYLEDALGVTPAQRISLERRLLR
jgi:protein-tyrosine phosphatase